MMHPGCSLVPLTDHCAAGMGPGQVQCVAVHALWQAAANDDAPGCYAGVSCDVKDMRRAYIS